jgi:type IV secretion system protein VirB9
MKRYLSILLAAAALAAAAPAAFAHPITGADGVLRFPFGVKEAPAVFCAPLYVCDITLQPGETVLNVALGDSVRWILSPAASGSGGNTPHILVKPTDANLSTNLIVTTNKRTYYVDLHSAKVPPMLRVGFFYPQEPDATLTADAQAQKQHEAMQPPAADEPAITPDALDFSYENSGARQLFPSATYNDGKHTYLRMDPHLPQLPVLFAIGPDGDQLINYRVKDGSMYIVDGVPDRMTLLLGSGKHQQRVTIARKS